MSDLFSPMTVGALTLPNRILMAPLTRCRADADHVPTDIMAEYYAQRASAGLIVAEATMAIEGNSAFGAREPGIYSDAQVAAWKKVTDAVHAKGGLIFLQIWHGGRACHPLLNGGAQPVAPSPLMITGDETHTPEGKKPYVIPRELRDDELPGIVEGFRKAAANAKAAGFDGVEVHAANGYLLDQFLHDNSNTRTDGYGGSIENRCRLLHEVVTACEAVFPGRIGVRLSPPGHFGDVHDSTPTATFTYAVQMLSKLRPLYIHLVEPRDWGLGESVGEDLTLTSALFRKHFDGPILSCGGHDLTTGEACLAAGDADAIVYGRHFISNPDLVERFRDGIALTPYDRATFYGGGATGYNTYTRADGSPEWD